jgi:hypothetical protein
MNGCAAMIGTMLAGYTAHPPQAGLESLDEAFEALAEADLDGFDVRVRQHQVEDQVLEGDAAERDAQAVHVREVGLSCLARRVDLREDHLAARTVLRTPGSDLPLQRAYLTRQIATRPPLVEQPEQRRCLERRVSFELADDPPPVVVERAGSRFIRARLLELAA